MPDVERALIIERISSQRFAATLAGGGASTFLLSGWVNNYGADWTVASHTFTLPDDGNALLTVVLERR